MEADLCQRRCFVAALLVLLRSFTYAHPADALSVSSLQMVEGLFQVRGAASFLIVIFHPHEL